MAANHIGNPKDIPIRTLEALKSSDLLIFEEDRIARRVLRQASLTREYLKFNEHNQQDTIDKSRQVLNKSGTIVYISDSGVPTLADPGSELLKLAYKLKAKISIIPGPSSITAALSACPFNIKNFIYAGFLPRKDNLREDELKTLLSLKRPILILDTPYRRKQLLQTCQKMLGKSHRALLALDISGENEEFLYLKLGEIISKTDSYKKLNFVLILTALK